MVIRSDIRTFASLARLCRSPERPTADELEQHLQRLHERRHHPAAMRATIDAKLTEAGWRTDRFTHFTGRDWLFKLVDDFFESRRATGGVLVLEGTAGFGKSAIITQLIERERIAKRERAAFYFRCGEGRVAVEELTRSIWEQLGDRFELPYEQPPPQTVFAKQLTERLQKIAIEKLESTERLTLFIDALDECTEPDEAVRLIPRSLSPNVFLICSSRPNHKERDHLAPLRTEVGIQIIPLHDQKYRDAQRQDIHKYFTQINPNPPTDAEAWQLVEACSETFIQATLYAEALRRKDATIPELLESGRKLLKLPAASRLKAYYVQCWDRVKMIPEISVLASLMGASLNCLGQQQLLDILGWDELERTPGLRRPSVWRQTHFLSAIESLWWMFERRTVTTQGTTSAFLQFRHQTLREFVRSEDGPASMGLEDSHEILADYYHEKAKNEDWEEIGDYGLRYAVRHQLLRTQKRETRQQLVATLSEPRYLQATLGNKLCSEPTGRPVFELLDDIVDTLSILKSKEREPLKSVHRFVAARSSQLVLAPQAYRELALAEPLDSPVLMAAKTAAAQDWQPTRPWLESLGNPQYDPNPELRLTHSIGVTVTAVVMQEDRHNHRTIAILGCFDGSIRRFILETGQEIVPALTGHTRCVTGLAQWTDTANKHILISLSNDITIRIWSLREGRCERVLEGHTDRVSSVAVLPDGRIVSGSHDTTLRVWDTQSGQSLRTLTGHTDRVSSVAVLPDGRIVSGSHDTTLRVWDTQSGQSLRTLTGHTKIVTSVAELPDGRIVSGSSDETLRVWDAQSGQSLRTLEGHTAGVTSVAVLPDGRIVSGSDDKTLRLWDAQSGQSLRTLTGHTDRVSSMAVLPDGRIVSGSDDKTLRLWDAQSGLSLRTLTGHTGSVMSLAVLPDGRIVSGSSDETLRLWDAQSGQSLRTLTGHTGSVSSMAVLPDGRIVSGSYDETLRLWDTQSGQSLGTLTGHTHWVNSVAVLPDGRIVSGSSDETLRLWDALRGRSYRTLTGHYGSVSSVAVLPDGRIVSGSTDCTLLLWDAQSGLSLRTLAGHTDGVSSMAVLPDGMIVSGSSDEETLLLWDALRGRSYRTLTGHTGSVMSLAVLPDGRIVSGSYDETLRLWDAQSGQSLRTLTGHTNWVNSVAVLPDGRIVSGSDDWTIRIWNSTTGECEVVYPCECAVRALAVRQFSPTEIRLAVGLENGRVLFFNVRNLK